MDPQQMMSESSSYNLGEIWPFSVNNIGDLNNGSFLQRSPHFPFGEMSNRGDVSVSVEESSVTEQSGGEPPHSRKKRREAAVLDDESSKLVSTSSGGDPLQTGSEGMRLKALTGSRENSVDLKGEAEASAGNNQDEHKIQPVEPPKQDYIHVRARRGQATDSHSIAERARREKISERMKILQDLVPGCNKVIGKALVLDEIINYIQSLQRQVEFLSMKLEAVNSRMSSGIEGFPAKDTFETTNIAFSSQAAPRDYVQVHMQVGGAFERTT
ncbi:hypothetical protein AMTRI_Chr03g140980 [Amborella trichopoda]